MIVAIPVRLAPRVALGPPALLDIFDPRLLLPRTTLPLQVQLRHLWIGQHELRDPGGLRCRVYLWLERALLFGPLVFHLLRRLIGHRLLQLLELLRELEELTAFVYVDHHAL